MRARGLSEVPCSALQAASRASSTRSTGTGCRAGRSSRSCPVRTGDSRRTSPQSATSPGILNTGADSQEVHLGGHLVGVYVLLKYGINAQNFVASEALMRSMISDLLPERLRAPIV